MSVKSLTKEVADLHSRVFNLVDDTEVLIEIDGVGYTHSTSHVAIQKLIEFSRLKNEEFEK